MHKLLYTLHQHKDIVTCVHLVPQLHPTTITTTANNTTTNTSTTNTNNTVVWLFSGSRDCTVIVWEIVIDKVKACIVSITPVRTLFGHDDAISCLASHTELDLIVSGSDDGTIIVHNLYDGKYIRSIVTAAMQGHDEITAFPEDKEEVANTPNNNQSTSPKETWKVTWLGISIEGYILSYTAEKRRLVTFSLNGGFICTRKIQESLYTLLLSQDGMVLLTGGSSCLVVLRWVSFLL